MVFAHTRCQPGLNQLIDSRHIGVSHIEHNLIRTEFTKTMCLCIGIRLQNSFDFPVGTTKITNLALFNATIQFLENRPTGWLGSS